MHIQLKRDYAGYTKGTVVIIDSNCGKTPYGAHEYGCTMPDGRSIRISETALKQVKAK